jgi:hypothetical protein
MDLTERQLELLRRMAALEPRPVLMGGYAEDALLAGTVTRPHEDVDWLLPRREADLRLEQARELGFTSFETWGEAAPGLPFYLFAEAGELKLDLGIADEVDGRPVMDVHRLFFEVGGEEAPAGYRVHLPTDTFNWPEAGIDGVPVSPASPLALYQIRTSIAGQGSFGELSAGQRQSARLLRERFFAGRADADLEPPIERLGH